MASILRSNVGIPEQYVEDIITATTVQSAILPLTRKMRMAYGTAKQPVPACSPSRAHIAWADAFWLHPHPPTNVAVPEASDP